MLHLAATPADVGLLMQLGVDGVFVGSGIFKSANPSKRAKAMVQAVTHYNDPKVLAAVSEDLGEPMVSAHSLSCNQDCFVSGKVGAIKLFHSKPVSSSCWLCTVVVVTVA